MLAALALRPRAGAYNACTMTQAKKDTTKNASTGTSNVALVQMAMVDDRRANLDKAVAMARQAARQGGQVLCLPELFRTPYFCQREDAALFDLAETIPGESTEALGAVARESAAAIVVPVFEKRAAGVYHNSAVVLDADGSIVGVYRKMHIPDDPGFYEKFYFTPGDLGFGAFNTRHGRVGTLICWDQWFPEAARLTALRGPAVLFYPTAIGWHPAEKDRLGAEQRDAWRTVQRGHAIANGLYVAAVNRVGHERPAGGDGIEFWGGSFLCDPFGVILAEASADKEEIVLAEVNPARVEEVRRGWPFLRDRRLDAYSDITRRVVD